MEADIMKRKVKEIQNNLQKTKIAAAK